jgi:hypothetical protein
MRSPRLLLVALGLSLGACLKPAPPPSAPPPEVAPQSTMVRLSTIPAATVATWLGTYRSAADTLVIRRSGDTLVADRSGLASLPLSLVGFATFADASGTAYLFNGQRLTTVTANGSRRDWSR